MWVALVSRVTAIAAFQITTSLIGNDKSGMINVATKAIEDVAAIWYKGFTSILHSFLTR
jgi:hypothetical protein